MSAAIALPSMIWAAMRIRPVAGRNTFWHGRVEANEGGAKAN
jgi:hypothetical protein